MDLKVEKRKDLVALFLKAEENFVPYSIGAVDKICLLRGVMFTAFDSKDIVPMFLVIEKLNELHGLLPKHDSSLDELIAGVESTVELLES